MIEAVCVTPASFPHRQCKPEHLVCSRCAEDSSGLVHGGTGGEDVVDEQDGWRYDCIRTDGKGATHVCGAQRSGLERDLGLRAVVPDEHVERTRPWDACIAEDVRNETRLVESPGPYACGRAGHGLDREIGQTGPRPRVEPRVAPGPAVRVQ